MPKDDEMVLVVPNDKLFNGREDYFEGFKDSTEVDFIDRIFHNHRFERHDEASKNFTLKQPIAYCAIVNPLTKKVYVYKRNEGAEGDNVGVEKLLQGNLSFGVGGHMVASEPGAAIDVVAANKVRELAEEAEIYGSKEFRFFGYVNNDDDRNKGVGKVHFGIMYLVVTNASIVRPKDKEALTGSMVHISELERMVDASKKRNPKITIEPWSEISFEPLKKYFGL